MSNGQTHGGKGSSTRPTDKKKYEDNYDAIFGKKNKDKKMLEEEELLDSYITSYIIPPETGATDISVGTIKEKLKGVSYEHGDVICPRCEREVKTQEIGKARIDGELSHVKCAQDELDEIGMDDFYD